MELDNGPIGASSIEHFRTGQREKPKKYAFLVEVTPIFVARTTIVNRRHRAFMKGDAEKGIVVQLENRSSAVS
jgi:hypothetical protein